MSDDKPSDRAIAQAFMHEVWNTQVKDGEASRLIDRVLHYAKEIDAQQPNGESAEPVEYQVRPSGFGEESWRSVSKREFEDCRDTPTGFPPDRWDRRALYAHPSTRSDEPTAEHWKATIKEDYAVHVRPAGSVGPEQLDRFADEYERRARTLAKEGK